MNEKEKGFNPSELGQLLMRVRSRAQLRQSELASRVRLSPAVLSRIESGERQVTIEEVKDILEQIGTSEANQLGLALQRTWRELPRPSLDHPDQNLLWDAEQVTAELVSLRDQPDTPHAFECRLSEYIEELKRISALIMNRNHQVAFIGSIGVGKSTAICRMTGLEAYKEDGTFAPVLEVGGGGVTVCEVHLRTGPSYGLIIEPRSDEEIRQDVADLADHVLKGRIEIGDEDGGTESQGISKELVRALRNMAKLAVRRKRGVDGKRITIDPAKDLATQYPTHREFIVEVLSRMELHRRDLRDIWYNSASGISPKSWLRETFADINNGRHPEVSLPKRIEVIVPPEQLFKTSDLTVRIIDTKGIDRTATREDIEVHLDDPHTLAVLCSNFNNAPSAEARLLLERAQEAGVRGLNVNAALLVFPRSGEAMAMKDDATSTPVDSVDEGYELKEEQVALALEPLGLDNLAVGFYNANEDSATRAQDFLVGCLNRARDTFRHRLSSVISDAQVLLENHGEQKIRAVQYEAGETLRTWITMKATVPAVQEHVQESLLTQIQDSYASTVRATVRREGEWTQLSYSHHIGHGARRLAVLALGKAVEGFTEHCKILAKTPKFAEATDLITQADRVLTTSYEDMLRKVQLMAQTIFRDALKSDSQFWQECMSEWGRGPGYKSRVVCHNRTWFDNLARRKLEEELIALIHREWTRTLSAVTDLLEPAN